MTGTERECPQRDEHTPCPEGYVAWHRWADGMNALGYRQRPHEGACGLYTQWITRTGRPARVSIRRALDACDRLDRVR